MLFRKAHRGRPCALLQPSQPSLHLFGGVEEEEQRAAAAAAAAPPPQYQPPTITLNSDAQGRHALPRRRVHLQPARAPEGDRRQPRGQAAALQVDCLGRPARQLRRHGRGLGLDRRAARRLQRRGDGRERPRGQPALHGLHLDEGRRARCPPPRPVCPNVTINCPDVQQAGTPMTFTASVSGGTPASRPSTTGSSRPGRYLRAGHADDHR